jgi:ABC-type Fe3+ transport system permease subunit
VGVLVALAVAEPPVALPASFLVSGEVSTRSPRRFYRRRWPRALLGVGVAAGTLLIGAGLAVLVSFYDFPGRRWPD